MKVIRGNFLIASVLLFMAIAVKAQALEFKPSVIFGDDDRKEMFTVDLRWQELGHAIAGKVSIEHLSKKGDGWELQGVPLSKRICSANRFADQTIVPSCSGFLVKDNMLVTAGHCVTSQADCDGFAWVFDYKLASEGDQSYINVKGDQVFRCKRIVSRRLEDFGAVDYAILELDRSTSPRVPMKMGFDLPLTVGQTVSSIGHPSGLPQKFIDNATVVEIKDNQRTIATDLDSFQGNSGSPIFDATTGLVIAVTSHGHADHIRDPEKGCKVPRICLPGDNCHLSSSSSINNLKNEPIFQNSQN